MKYLFGSILGMALISLGAQQYTIKMETGKPDAVYRKGETMTFSMTLLEDGKPSTGGKFEYRLQSDGKPEIKETVESGGKPVVIDTQADAPGWTSVTATPLDENGAPRKQKNRQGVEQVIRFAIGAMTDPLEIKPGMNEPADFDAFWKARREELNRVPLRADEKSIEVPDAQKDRYLCFDVKVDCAGSKPVSGYLTVPVNAAPGSLKAVVQYHASGVRSAVRSFQPNAITFDVNAHGIDNGQPDAFYRELAGKELANYPFRNAGDRERFYFHDMFLRVMRALDYIKSRPEWDGKTLIVSGSSQGGAQALAAAGLDPQVTLCLAGVPALCDHGGIFAGRNSGWPRLIKLNNGQPADPKIVAACGYYDIANFTARIKAETYITTGFADSTCAPTSVYAAYNRMPAATKKAIHTVPTAGHNDMPNPGGNRRMAEVLRAGAPAAAPESLFTAADTRILGGKLQYTEGLNGPAAIFGNKLKAVIPLAGRLNPESWSISLWVKPLDWLPKTENFVFFFALQGEKSDNRPVDMVISKFCKGSALAINLRDPEVQNFSHDIALWEMRQWHHLALTFQDGVFRYYLDGAQISEKKSPRNVAWQNLTVGTPYDTWAFIGEEKTAITAPRIASAMSAEQVQAEYRSGATLQGERQQQAKQPPQSHWTFDNGIPADVKVNGQVTVIPGLTGNAAQVTDGTFEPASRDYRSAQGSCFFWVRPHWQPDTEDCYFFALLTAGKQRLLLYKPHKLAAVRLIYQDLDSGKSSFVDANAAGWRPEQWLQIGFSWGRENCTLYVNGLEAGSLNCSLEGGDIRFGKVLPTWAKLGKEPTDYDEVRIFKRPINDFEIKADYDLHSKPQTVNSTAVSATPDLAGANNRCIGIASSFDDYQRFYTDNLFDGKSDTFWRSREEGTEAYLELRWPFPRRIDRLILRDAGKSIESGSIMRLNLHNADWVEVKKLSRAELDSGEFALPETDASALRLYLKPQAGQKLTASALEAYGPQQPGTGLKQPYWDAWYVWFPEPDKVHKATQPRYFRKSFQIDKLPVSAFVQARSNDYYKLYLNGSEIASGSTEIRPFNVLKLLQKGENTIAAVADLSRNPGQWGWGEFIAELSLNYPDGSTKIGTGPDWKSSDQAPENWNLNGFDDRQWPAPFCYKRPPEGPWGKIHYFPSGICETITPGSTGIQQLTARPGDTVKLNLSLSPRHALSQDYDFLLEAGSATFAAMYAAVPSLKGQKENFQLTAELTLPPWTPSGKQPVWLSAAGHDNGLALNLPSSPRIQIAEIDVAPRPVPPPATGKAAITYHNGQAAFNIDGNIVSPFFWRYINIVEPRRLYNTSHYSSINIHQFLLYGGLIDAGNPDWNARLVQLDRDIRTLLEVSPDARVIVLYDLRPTHRWLQENPGEMLLNAFGKKEGVSFASAKYRNACFDFIRSSIGFLQKQPYWNRVVGFQPWTCGMPDSVTGGVAENLWQTDRSKITVGDFNPQALDRFREFLRQRYDNDAVKLQSAWKKPGISFENATPEIAELTAEGVDGGVFRNPALGRMTFDYMDFMPTMLSSLTLEMCRLVKQLTGNTRMTFVHYGFLIAHMQGYNLPGGVFNNNNFDLPALLADDAVDGYIGAPHYSYRLAGTPCVTYFPWSSFRLHNRMYLPDDDTRYYQTGTKNYGHNRSIRESQAITRRNLGADLTRNFGSWFSDMSQGKERSAVSWTGEPEVVQMIEEMNRVYQTAQKEGYRSAAEIAVVFSTDSMRYLDFFHGPTLSNNIIQWMFYSEFFKIGAPFDVYLTGDLKHRNFSKQYKLYVMMNCFFLSDEDRAQIERMKRDGVTFLWFYAPGYISNDKGLDTGAIAKLTGMNVEMLPGKEKMSATPATHPLTTGLPEGYRFGASAFAVPMTQKIHASEFGPRFRIIAPDSDVAARFDDGKAALAAKDFGHWKSVYSVIPRLERNVLRNICRGAGVHIYTDEDIAFDANRNFIILHNGYEKERNFTLSLPRRADVTDSCTGKLLGKNVDSLPIRLEPCSTLVLHLK